MKDEELSKKSLSAPIIKLSLNRLQCLRSNLLNEDHLHLKKKNKTLLSTMLVIQTYRNF